MMKQTTTKRILLIGAIGFTLGLLVNPQTSRAQTMPSSGADTGAIDASAKTANSGSLPLPRSEALAAISENNHLILLPWYNLGTAPSGAWVPGYMKLLTPIAQNENNMFSIKIKGYRYGTGGTPVEIRCGGYAYSGSNSLISSDCLTEGTPDRVGIGTENGKVIITIGTNESGAGVWYYDHLTAEYSGDLGKDPGDFSWAFVYNEAPATTNTHNVVIKDSAGTITTTGSVGIATTSPLAPFHVKGGTAMQGGWNRTGVLEATFPVMTFGSGTSGSSPKWAGIGYDYSVDAMRFWTGATSSDVTSVGATMSMSAGKVGIGTSSPTRTLDLSTSGQLTFGNDGYSSTGSPGLFWYSDNTNYGIYKSSGSWSAPNYQQLNLNFATGIVIDGGSAYGKSGTVLQPSSGNVGIGTASPSYKLDVNGPPNTNGSTVGIKAYNAEPALALFDSTQNRSLYLGYSVANDAGSIFAYGRDGTGAKNIVIAQYGGSVGIGTPSPGDYKLNVNGDTNVKGNLNITANGAGTGNIVAAGTINAKYQDVAEWVPASEQIAPGTVVVLDSTKSNQVTSSSVSYDTRVAGVISEQPGIALGEKSENKVLVATTGRVRVKVDATKGPIHIGDLLVTSDVPGVAMKSEPVEFAGRKMHMPGTLIGKALEPLEKGKGEILVLLSLQ